MGLNPVRALKLYVHQTIAGPSGTMQRYDLQHLLAAPVVTASPL
jgi:hypothetical protein